MSRNVHELAAKQFSFANGVEAMRNVLASIEFFLGDTPALHVTSARPAAPRYTMPALTAKDLVEAIKPKRN